MMADRKDTAELLPFLVNGTLDGEERDRVTEAVASDPVFQGEVVALQALRDRMQAETEAYSPGEFGLARLMRDIDDAPAAPTQSRKPVLPWAVAAAAVLALAAVLVTGSLAPQPDGPVYEQASGDAGDVGLTVAFRPDAAQGDIAGLLLDSGAIIVDGPSALGLYRVVSPDGTAPAVLAEALRARVDLVESVDLMQ